MAMYRDITMWIIIGVVMAAVTVYCTSGEKTSTPIKCKKEDVYHEEPLYWLNWYDVTTCNMHCPDNCTCVLGDSVLKTTCTNETTSAEIRGRDPIPGKCEEALPTQCQVKWHCIGCIYYSWSYVGEIISGSQQDWDIAPWCVHKDGRAGGSIPLW